MLRVAIGLLCLCLCLVLPRAAFAEKRVALVIGNGAYTKVPKLENPKNDAAAMEAMLKAAGFDAVVRANDLGVAAMRRALRDFSDTIFDADIAVVFYAGHGMEIGGVNYLIPTDAVLERDIDAQDEAVSLDRVSQILEPAKRLRLVILDACRDNPFVRSMRRTVATRAIRSGYGEIDERSLPPNTLVAYAQRAGATAEDGAGTNSPYTTALLKHLPTPGLDIELALRRVRDDVLKLTRNRQEPFRYGSLGGAEIALVAGKTSPVATTSPAATPLSEAERAWGLAKDTNSVAVLESYAARYKDTFYADLARARIEDLKRQQLAAAAAPPPPKPATPPKAAEPVVAAPPPTSGQPFTLPAPITLKLQDTFPTADLSSRDPLNAVLRDLGTLSGGQLKIELLAAGAVGPAFQMLDFVGSGVLDAAWTSPAYWYGRRKAFGIFSGTVPGGLDAAAFVRWLEGEGSLELNRLIAEVSNGKARSLPCAVIGPGGDWFKKPIAKIDDFRGLKFRSVGLPAEVGREIGLAVTILPGGEIVSAFDRGLIDGSDWTTPQSAIALGLPQVTKVLHYPGWSRPVHLFELIVNEATWSKLGRNGQQGVEQACRQSLRRSLAMIPSLEQQGLTELRSRGVTVLPYPQAMLADVRRAGQRVLDNMAREDASFARVLASYNKYR